jgi:hypothetical protein
MRACHAVSLGCCLGPFSSFRLKEIEWLRIKHICLTGSPARVADVALPTQAACMSYERVCVAGVVGLTISSRRSKADINPGSKCFGRSKGTQQTQ